MLKLSDRKRKILDAIGNASRLKILMSLCRSGEELTVYKISRFTGLSRNSVRKNLKKLMDNDLVSKIVYGEIYLYKANTKNEYTNALIQFFAKTRF